MVPAPHRAWTRLPWHLVSPRHPAGAGSIRQ